MKIWELCEQGI